MAMKKNAKWSVFMVDDSDIARFTFRLALELNRDFQIIGEAATAEDALDKLNKTPCDLAIVDVSLDTSAMDGLELTVEIKRRWPKLPVLIFSVHPESDYAIKAKIAGADGYISKSRPFSEVFDIVYEILRREPPRD
jgi:two-component system, NarL family, invasion response regulator UvrY